MRKRLTTLTPASIVLNVPTRKFLNQRRGGMGARRVLDQGTATELELALQLYH